jgi:hypothetical protein
MRSLRQHSPHVEAEADSSRCVNLQAAAPNGGWPISHVDVLNSVSLCIGWAPKLIVGFTRWRVPGCAHTYHEERAHLCLAGREVKQRAHTDLVISDSRSDEADGAGRERSQHEIVDSVGEPFLYADVFVKILIEPHTEYGAVGKCMRRMIPHEVKKLHACKWSNVPRRVLPGIL